MAFTALASAQDFPWPRSVGSPNDSCTTCKSPWTNLPTYPYSLPLKDHAGRFVDSTRTRDYQQPLRTLRARGLKISPENGQIYMMLGSSFVTYKLSNFFSSKLGQPLSVANNHQDGNTTVPGEQYLAWDGYFYAEKSNWNCPIQDGQDRLFDFDWDDRGDIYLAYSVFHWGILQQTPSGVTSVKQVVNDADPSPTMIASFKAGSKYYAYVTSSSSAKEATIWDVTNVTNPSLVKKFSVYSGSGEGARAFAKTDAAGTVIAMVDYHRNLRISSGSGVVSGNPETLIQSSYTGSGGGYVDVTSDGTNFYAIEVTASMNGQAIVHEFSPVSPGVANGYHETVSQVVSRNMKVGGIRYGAGYISAWGIEGGVFSIRLFKVNPTSFEEIQLGAFIPNYYFAAPAGYAQPDGYAQNVTVVQPWRDGGKDYLFVGDYGLGDVYELQAGDSIDIATVTSASRGTTNPNTPTGSAKPFPGDLVTFSSSTTAKTQLQLSWDFGNPESTDNSGTSYTGTNVSHRFFGMTTANTITTPKTVKAQNIADASMNDSESVVLAVPTPRFKIAGMPVLFTQPAVSSTAPVVFGDQWVDASDGVIEGHYDVWTLDGAVTNTTPDMAVPVGLCGAHTLSYAARYGAHSGTGTGVTSTGSAYTAAINSFNYSVRPFAPQVTVAVSGSTMTFTDATRFSSAIFPAGANATYSWALKNAAGSTVSTGTGTQFVVSPIPASGSSVVLTVSVSDAIAETSCASMTSASITYPITVPDPAINTSGGCSNALGPCTISVASASGADQSAWTYQWKVNNVTRPQTTQSVDAQAAGWFPSQGTYTVAVTATHSATSLSATAQSTLSMAAPICSGKPTGISVGYSGSLGCNTSSACQAGETISFSPYAFGYTFQDCDSFTWNFGDGSTGSGRNVSHTYNTNGPRTVTLTVANSSGSGSATTTVTVGTTTPPPPPPPPTGCPTAAPGGTLDLSYAGPTSGCSATAGSCATGESIRFQAAPWGYTIQSCDQITWSFGDGAAGSGQVVNHLYASAGTYTVSLTIRNSLGSKNATRSVTVTGSGGGGGGGGGSCPTAAPGGVLDLSFTGATSQCSATGSTPCSPGEAINFAAAPWGYNIQTCDTVSWNFGDSATAQGKNVSHTYTLPGAYNVQVTIANSLGTKSATRPVNVGGTGVKPATNITFTVSPTNPVVGQSVTFTGSADSETPIQSWSWNFGDGNAGSGQTVTHTFTQAKNYTVSLTVNNGYNNPPVGKTITVADATQFAFLLPVVVAHLDGQNSSQWSTDLFVYNTDSTPVTLRFEYQGNELATSTVGSTSIFGDLLYETLHTQGAGPVIVRGTAKSAPQMWTRTYTVGETGVGTYGQLIPAIPLIGSSNVTTDADSYAMAGLEISPRFRTNLGLVNPTGSAATITVTAYDDQYGLQLGSFTVPLGSFQFTQIGDLNTRIPSLQDGRTFSLNVKSSGSALTAYASMIDQVTNDPVYEGAVPLSSTTAADMQLQRVPVSHFQSWRSDVTIFNPDSKGMAVDLTYYDGAGTKQAEAKNLMLGGNAFLRIPDIVWSGDLTPSITADSIGTLDVQVSSDGAQRYPIVFSRTYNDQGAAGTYGQGIPAFPVSQPNVETNKPAVIPGVRSDLSYYTNVGLVNVGTTAAQVKITLLSPTDGAPLATWERTDSSGQPLPLQPNESIVATDIFKAMQTQTDRGTLKIELVSGDGVWAYASVIDKTTRDPEYVPAIPLQ